MSRARRLDRFAALAMTVQHDQTALQERQTVGSARGRPDPDAAGGSQGLRDHVRRV